MKVIFFNLLLVGLANCAPPSSINDDKHRNIFGVGTNNGIAATPPIFGLFNGIAEMFTYNSKEATKCANDFETLEKSKLVKLQNGNIYYFPTSELPYADAKAYCDTRGMRIVVLETLAENLLLCEYLAKLLLTTGNFGETYIGLRSRTAGSGIYTLEYTNAPLTYDFWYPDMPDPDYDCAAIGTESTLAGTGWFTLPCDVPLNFVCELPARCNRYLAATVETFDDL